MYHNIRHPPTTYCIGEIYAASKGKKGNAAAIGNLNKVRSGEE